MGFIIFDYDEEILRLHLAVVLITLTRRCVVDLLVTSKRLIFIDRGNISLIWYCDLIGCRLISRCFTSLVEFKFKTGSCFIKCKDYDLLYENTISQPPGIAQLVIKHRENEVKSINNFIVDEIVNLKENIDRIIALSDRVSPILKPITCSLNEIISFVDSSFNLPNKKSNDIVDIVHHIMESTSVGIILLIDLYCILNRCDLGYISPSRLLDIIKCIDGYEMVNLNGVIALVDLSMEDLVLDYFTNLNIPDGITLNHYCMINGISFIVGEYHLSIAESRGLILRDSSIYGIRYYKLSNSSDN